MAQKKHLTVFAVKYVVAALVGGLGARETVRIVH